MYHIFLENIKQHKLFLPQQKILLAVSGGLDSMVMSYLFMEAGFNFAIAHFNHNTRNGESDIDELFVKDFCSKKNIEFFSTKVDITGLLNKGDGNNFQDLARKYRYHWLEKIRKSGGFDYVATAHHEDDNIETFLYKISYGSGLGGLKGINRKIDNIIRPLLDFSRQDIEQYANENNIVYREDSSNISDKYSRNYIRHHIIPGFEKLNDNFKNRITVTIKNLGMASDAIEFFIDNYYSKYIVQDNKVLRLEKDVFFELVDNKAVIYYFLFKYDFNASQIEDIIKAKNKTGAIFYSNSHTLLVDRKHLLIRKIEMDNKKNISEIDIFKGTNRIGEKRFLHLEEIRETEYLDFKKGMFINGDRLKFPLKLRSWRPGDRFRPFGLKGKRKKLKVYFTDRKLSRFDKYDAYVLTNGDDIVAVLPYDISWDYRIVPEEVNKILKIYIE